ncbi:hypothetical protein KIW84_072974 [Lathyrus oleraceus]|uniref:Uncharacterized protein n=1 Tax=Pisum sativum TaxID=3888 RepID=A0A9D4ZWP5_PEA|nr:hypothetical protein KIW84_072974 [Pisum sativum]
MEGRFFLDVVISQSSAIFELFASKDEPLLVWGNALFVLDLGLDIVNGIRALHLKGDGLSSESLHKDLHPTAKSQHKMEGGFLLYVVISKSTPILELLASKNETLLVRRDPFLVLNLGLNIVYGI